MLFSIMRGILFGIIISFMLLSAFACSDPYSSYYHVDDIQEKKVKTKLTGTYYISTFGNNRFDEGGVHCIANKVFVTHYEGGRITQMLEYDTHIKKVVPVKCESKRIEE